MCNIQQFHLSLRFKVQIELKPSCLHSTNLNYTPSVLFSGVFLDWVPSFYLAGFRPWFLRSEIIGMNITLSQGLSFYNHNLFAQEVYMVALILTLWKIHEISPKFLLINLFIMVSTFLFLSFLLHLDNGKQW
jgi:hypothetical protein